MSTTVENLDIAQTSHSYQGSLRSLPFVPLPLSPRQFPITPTVSTDPNCQQSRSPLKTIRTLRDPDATLALVAVKPGNLQGVEAIGLAD